VKARGTPTIEERSAGAIHAAIVARRPAFVPELAVGASGPAAALLQVIARYSAIVADRLNQAPDKNRLAFLDLLGIELLPALPARAPVAFQPLPLTADAAVPAGTRLGATMPGADRPIVFETERTMALAAARLVQIVSLDPARDAYADHSLELAGGRPVTLFSPLRRIPHALYLGHRVLLAFTAGSRVDVQIGVAMPAGDPLDVVWEHWDGQTWRPFQVMTDGTAGFTRSGTVALRAVCGRSERQTVAGLQSCWVQARLRAPLPPDPVRVLPSIDRARLRVKTSRPLAGGATGPFTGLAPDKALAGDTTLDVTKTFYPMGRLPDQDSVFYFSNDEALGKPGALVDVGFTRIVTPEEEADAFAAQFALDVDNARTALLNAATQAAESAIQAAEALYDLASTAFTGTVARFELASAITAAKDELALLTAPSGIVDLPPVLADLHTKALAINPDVTFLSTFPPSTDVNLAETQSRLQNAKADLVQAISSAHDTLAALATLGPVSAAAAGGAPPPELPDPRAVWEYFDGQRWKTLVAPSANPVANLMASGRVTFTVPEDLAAVTLQGEAIRAVRVRLSSGSYNQLQMVTWYDQEAQQTNVLPVIKPRPPALTGFAIGYAFTSAWTEPTEAVALNDFQHEYRSRDLVATGRPFPPFRPVGDALPTIYLGFDQPLPNDFIGLYFGVDETGTPAVPLVWEAWDGRRWTPLSVEDGTGGLTRPGIVSFLAPPVAARPEVTIKASAGSSLTVGSALEAARFQAADLVRATGAGESVLGVVRDVDAAVVRLEAPAPANLAQATLAHAGLPRFGQPLDWVRVRPRLEGVALDRRLVAIAPNAAWARQVETIVDETLGAGTAQPNQTFFFQRTPVLPGERLEVRELEGARADVEYEILRGDLLARGFTDDDLRVSRDVRTGRVTEVWVRWQPRPHLHFSGPDDRHYALERTRGRVRCGDGRRGRLVPAGSSNVRARRYQTGGGLSGNVAAGRLTQLLSGVPAQSVTNPRAAEGGADGEALAGVYSRGPLTLRHRGRAVCAADYEALAREASPAVALARALPATTASHVPVAGHVTVIIVPHSHDPRPQPTFELRREVGEYLARRAPASLAASRIAVVGPTYLPVGVGAVVVPRDPGDARAIKTAVVEALARFLHPLTGGPDGEGWGFGRDVFASDVASVLAAIPGIDAIRRLQLQHAGVAEAHRIAVPPDRIVVLGDLSVDVGSDVAVSLA
jgi:hypothetical protein